MVCPESWAHQNLSEFLSLLKLAARPVSKSSGTWYIMRVSFEATDGRSPGQGRIDRPENSRTACITFFLQSSRTKRQCCAWEDLTTREIFTFEGMGVLPAHTYKSYFCVRTIGQGNGEDNLLVVKEALAWELLGLIVTEGSSTRRSSCDRNETPAPIIRGIDATLIASGSFSSYPSKPLAVRKCSSPPMVLLSVRSPSSASGTAGDSVRPGRLTTCG